jgi:hypothetical protein
MRFPKTRGSATSSWFGISRAFDAEQVASRGNPARLVKLSARCSRNCAGQRRVPEVERIRSYRAREILPAQSSVLHFSAKFREGGAPPKRFERTTLALGIREAIFRRPRRPFLREKLWTWRPKIRLSRGCPSGSPQVLGRPCPVPAWPSSLWGWCCYARAAMAIASWCLRALPSSAHDDLSARAQEPRTRSTWTLNAMMRGEHVQTKRGAAPVRRRRMALRWPRRLS